MIICTTIDVTLSSLCMQLVAPNNKLDVRAFKKPGMVGISFLPPLGASRIFLF